MSFRTVFIESPCKLSYKSGYMVVRKENDTAKIHLSEVSTVILQTEQVYASAYLFSELAKRKIALVVSDEQHNPIGEYLPLYGAYNVNAKIQLQLAWGEPIKKRVWQRVVKEKITHQASVLEKYEHDEKAHILKAMVAEVRSGDTTNREAAAARIYFATLFGDDFSRDDDCLINDALNYGYAVLLSMVNQEIVSRGFLTQCGICHRGETNQFNFACDLMEPFRPLIDALVIENLAGDFDKYIRRTLADVANVIVQYRDGNYKVGSVVSLYVQDCLNALNKKIPVDNIEKFELL